MTSHEKKTLICLLEKLLNEALTPVNPDLEAARRIAANKSKQTGKNAEKFLNGSYDHAYGVQCVMAGIKYGREN